MAVGAHTEVGIVAFNAGHWPLAHRYLAVGRALAEELQDPALRAQTLGATGCLFSSALRGGQGGDPARATALIDQALAVLPTPMGWRGRT